MDRRSFLKLLGLSPLAGLTLKLKPGEVPAVPEQTEPKLSAVMREDPGIFSATGTLTIYDDIDFIIPTYWMIG